MDYYSYPDFGSHFTSQVFRHSKYASANSSKAATPRCLGERDDGKV